MTILDIIYVRPETFEGISRLVTPWSAAWLNWWTVAALLCLFIAVLATPDLYISRIQMLLGLQRQSSIFYQTSLTDIRTLVTGCIFTLIAFSLTLAIDMYPEAGFSNKMMFVTLGALTLYFALKAIITAVICYVFYDIRHFVTFMPTVAQIHFLTATALFAVTLFRLYIAPDLQLTAHYTLIIILITALCVCVVKITQHFFTKNIDILHIFLYLCTLEILPLASILLTYPVWQKILAL